MRFRIPKVLMVYGGLLKKYDTHVRHHREGIEDEGGRSMAPLGGRGNKFMTMRYIVFAPHGIYGSFCFIFWVSPINLF